MANYLKLRKFRQEELILNEDEARTVLRFIFEPVDRLIIDSLNVNDAAREFAQGLLIEVIDASCSVGFVESIFRSATNPTKGAIEILKKFGPWFSFDAVTLTCLQQIWIAGSFYFHGLIQGCFPAEKSQTTVNSGKIIEAF